MCDRPTRLRKAILFKTALDKTAPYVTSEDIKRRWGFLSECGYTNLEVKKIANGDDINEEIFLKIMTSLRSHL